MNPWIGNVIFLIAIVTSVAIRIPHDKISQKTKVAESHKGLVEKMLLGLMMVGLVLLPVVSFTPVLSFSAYPLNSLALMLGVVSIGLGLWLFYRSHVDLGKNWSVSLEIRKDHALVSNGVYKLVRHPMYTSLFLQAIGQAFLLPNWIAGPATLVAFTLMFSYRLGAEEKMMLDKFGEQYSEYMQRTDRLIPGVW